MVLMINNRIFQILSLRKFYLCLLLVCSSYFSMAQNAMPQINSPIPISPNAASFAKYGETPVGYATGIPNISVPVYDIVSGSLKLPISLSYHAGGMKVEDVASWVGLGWSLNAGGVISRQVRGLPDEAQGGYVQSYNQTLAYPSMSTSQKQAYLDDVASGVIDSQQDIFTYNLLGESGKFLLNHDGTVATIPVSKNKFEFGTFLGVANAWKITDVNGTVYYFTLKETTQTTSVINGASSSPTPAAITSWYIAKISSVTGADAIDFTYETQNTNFQTGRSQTKYVLQSTNPACNGKQPDLAYSYNIIDGFRLSKINFKGGEVKFNKQSQSRVDYNSDYALQSIEIYSSNSSFYRKYLFYQSYVVGSAYLFSDTDEMTNRLFVDSIGIYDASQRINSYVFSYNKSIGFPSRTSFSQDHWGYNNNASNGVNLVPTTILPSPMRN